jgi:aryl-alcohol dehydrogenase-like predicted oxidoreductase
MERRVLGKTNHRSSIVTLGGAIFIYPIEQEKGDAFVKYALDSGVNHIDVAPTYGDAEVKLGKWVKEYRDDVFLGCKTGKRTKKEAEEELRQSLERLQTDYFDLYQFHGLDTPGDLATVVGKTGALHAFKEAKEEGLINYIGITSHNPVNILKAFELHDFDTVLLPVNYVLHAHPEPQNDYEPVLKKAKEKNIGVIAMKSIAKGPYPTEKKTHNTWYQPFAARDEIGEALRFTLSQLVTTATTSSDMEIARMQIEVAENFSPLALEGQHKLLMEASDYKPLFPRS